MHINILALKRSRMDACTQARLLMHASMPPLRAYEDKNMRLDYHIYIL